ncbi:MAG: hypothetical protein ACLR78_04425 [Roseburia sp.]
MKRSNRLVARSAVALCPGSFVDCLRNCFLNDNDSGELMWLLPRQLPKQKLLLRPKTLVRMSGCLTTKTSRRSVMTVTLPVKTARLAPL